MVLLLTVLILTSMLISLSGCECGTAINIVIENQTGQFITVSYHEQTNIIGNLEPGQQISLGEVSDISGEHLIIAKNAKGEIIFSEKYNHDPNNKYYLKKIKHRVYKAVIPALEKGMESGDNVTLNK